MMMDPGQPSAFAVLNDVDAPEELLAPAGFVYEDREGNTCELSQADHDWLVQDLVAKFQQYETDRQPAERRWARTEKAVHGVASQIKGDRFYGLVPFGKQSLQVLLAHFWNRALQTPDVFFNVHGEDQQSQEMAPLQKEILLQHCERDQVQIKLDEAVYDAIMKGIAIAHVGYCKKMRDLHGPANLATHWKGVQAQACADPAEPMDVQQVEYEGATLTRIDPRDFVFDTNPYKKWDDAFKGFRTYQAWEDIADDDNNQNYDELRELVKGKQDKTRAGHQLQGKNRKKQVNTEGAVNEAGEIEVLEIHGAIRLRDGTLLRNWLAVVAGRKKLIRFEKNPIFVCPFQKWEYDNSGNGWPVSPIEYILPLIDAGSMLLSTGVSAGALAINPPWLAPEDSMAQKKHFLTEGAIIKYKPSALAPNHAPQPVQFNFQAPFPFLQLFESQAEATTGATRQLSGNVTTNDKAQTATEFQGLQVVGNMVLDRVVDLFNKKFKLPVLEKIALVNAMFNPAPLEIAIENEKGIREFQQVEPRVYFGNYRYVVESNKDELERKQNLTEKAQFFAQGLADETIAARMKKIELFKDILVDMGYGKAGRYFMDDAEYTEHQLREGAIEVMVQSMLAQRAQAEAAKSGMLINGGVNGPEETIGGGAGVPQTVAGSPGPVPIPGMGAA